MQQTSQNTIMLSDFFHMKNLNISINKRLGFSSKTNTHDQYEETRDIATDASKSAPITNPTGKFFELPQGAPPLGSTKKIKIKHTGDN